MASEYGIVAQNVKKYFGDVKALDGVSLEAKVGKVYGLLGPNGAGKTTLVRIMATLLTPDAGQVVIGGLDVVKSAAKVREIIGLAGQFAAVDDFLTGREVLELVARLYHLPPTETKRRSVRLLERLSLSDAADRLVRTYSGGMRRRLDLGASLIAEPAIIFLDEPTTGLDPRTRLELWDIIRELTQAGTTILLTTQYLEEADALADYMSVIDHGKVVIAGTSEELKDSLGQDIIELSVAETDLKAAQTALQKIAATPPQLDELTRHITLPTKKGSATLLAVAEALKSAHIEPTELSLHRPSLDDVFLAVTGHKTTPTAEPAKKGRRP